MACTEAVLCIGLLLVFNLYPDSCQNGIKSDFLNTPEKERLDYINSHPENTYFFSIQKNIGSPSEMCEIWKTVREHYCDNVFYLGGWTARLPYRMRMLSERNITNPTKALLEDDYVYTVQERTTTDFLRRNYGENISISGLDEVSGTMFVQYTCPVSDERLVGKEVLVTELQIKNDIKEQVEGWYITGKTECEENETLYCNADIEGIRYTYRVKTDANGCFTAFFYEIPSDVDFKYANIAFYKK